MFINFRSVDNIRDIGEIKTTDGHYVKSKVLLRSADLCRLSKDELEILKKDYNLKTVIDFRSLNSHTHKKDLIDDSIKCYHFPTLKILETQPYVPTITVTPEEFFLNVYRSLASYDEAYLAYINFFKVLLNNKEGAILWHCTSGKDRTGIACALLLYILGCDWETIYKEHMVTNEYTIKLYESKIKELGNPSEKEKKFYEINYIAKIEFFEAYLEVIKNKFGSIDSFIYKGLKLTDSDIAQLRKMYLVKRKGD